MFNTVLGQDGLICDDVGWQSRLNKGGGRIYDVGIGILETMEGTGSSNQAVPDHGAMIGSSFILVDVERIP